MKKLLPALVLSFVLCFSMAGCNGGNDNEKEAEPELKATSIVGDWECTDLSMKEGDTTMQIVGDKIYFSDKNCNLCSMNLDTSNEKTIISKEVYYPYVLPNNT